MTTRPTPRILVLSAPSGGGKTSLARALAERREDVGIAVSHTTRNRRPGETDGVHYFFVDHPVFERMIRDNRFIEYAEVFENYYGTSVDAVESLALSGRQAILDIDWQGARSVRGEFPDAVTVFVMPPSTWSLEQRLRQRGQDSEKVISQRMQEAEREMSHRDEFDEILVNDDFNRTLNQLEDIVNRMKNG